VDPTSVDQESGHGLEGMLRRLESVGGRLDIRRRDLLDAQTFTATAWVPMRTVYP
jgi:signal transduction histidine kinase